MKKLSLFTIAYDPKTVNTLSSLPSHQKTTGLLRLSDPAKILDLVKNDNAPNHNNIEIIFDVLKRLETVILSKAGNHIYKISLTMLTKSTLKPIKKKAYDILIKSLDGPINTQFGLEIVLEQLSEEGFGEEYLQVVTKILTTLEVQAVELPGISPSNQILDLVLLSVQRFDYSDLYLLHLTTIIKLQVL